jgi:transcriptional regulator with XRE-family HTH domain
VAILTREKSTVAQTFGRIFKSLRVRRGLNRVDLQRGSGVARTTIVVYEGLSRFNGQPEKLRAILAYLHRVSPLTRAEAQSIADLVDDPGEVLPESEPDSAHALATRLSLIVGEEIARDLIRSVLRAVDRPPPQAGGASPGPAGPAGPILPVRHPDIETDESAYSVRIYHPQGGAHDPTERSESSDPAGSSAARPPPPPRRAPGHG